MIEIDRNDLIYETNKYIYHFKQSPKIFLGQYS